MNNKKKKALTCFVGSNFNLNSQLLKNCNKIYLNPSVKEKGINSMIANSNEFAKKDLFRNNPRNTFKYLVSSNANDIFIVVSSLPLDREWAGQVANTLFDCRNEGCVDERIIPRNARMYDDGATAIVYEIGPFLALKKSRISKAKSLEKEVEIFNLLNERGYSCLPQFMVGHRIGDIYYIIREFSDIYIDWDNPKIIQALERAFSEFFDMTENFGFFEDTVQLALRDNGELFIYDLGSFNQNLFKEVNRIEFESRAYTLINPNLKDLINRYDAVLNNLLLFIHDIEREDMPLRIPDRVITSFLEYYEELINFTPEDSLAERTRFEEEYARWRNVRTRGMYFIKFK